MGKNFLSRDKNLVKMRPLFSGGPSEWITSQLTTGPTYIDIPFGRFCIAEAEAAREVLWNKNALYKEHSDFFSTAHGTLTPRSLQIKMGLQVKLLLDEHLKTIDVSLQTRKLRGDTKWPKSANQIMYSLMHNLIVSPWRPQHLKTLVSEIVRCRIYSHSKLLPWSQQSLRSDLFTYFSKLDWDDHDMFEEPFRDIFDVVGAFSNRNAPNEQAAQLFTSFVFALVGSTGFALAWSIYLAALDKKTDQDPASIVSESLRLFPVAWLMEREVAKSHNLFGIDLSPNDKIFLSPLAIHRNPRHWSDADQFFPSRWKKGADRSAWLPFGAGPHSCVAVQQTLTLVSNFVREIFDQYEIQVLQSEKKAVFGAALKPPNFKVRAIPRNFGL